MPPVAPIEAPGVAPEERPQRSPERAAGREERVRIAAPHRSEKHSGGSLQHTC